MVEKICWNKLGKIYLSKPQFEKIHKTRLIEQQYQSDIDIICTSSK